MGIVCRYNYTVYQDTEHGRQKIIKDGVDTLISVVHSVGSHLGTLVCRLGALLFVFCRCKI